MELVPQGRCRWLLPRQGQMRVPGVVFATRSLLPAAVGDRSLDQVVNVACLPGIVDASYAMPDVHWGYGFPIGGVAATDIEDEGVVSPGGVGFDISCGVRLLVSQIHRNDLCGELGELMNALGRMIPRGTGPGGVLPRCSADELDDILVAGAAHLVARGMGTPDDLKRCESGGTMPGAGPEKVSTRARERGARQVGSLGSGNHFAEVQAVDQVLDPATAEAFGLRTGSVCVLVHCGSRGLGHQVCTDYVRLMDTAMHRYGIHVPDRQLACVPVPSAEGESYLAAMAAAANYGMANRQALTHAIREAFAAAGLGELVLLYDVSHNLAKIETHPVDSHLRTLCVHRKGATRAFPPHHPELPADLAPYGQPVLVPGSMGTASYVLVGVEASPAFHSACHGAGRVLSRHAAARHIPIEKLRSEMAAAGILVRGASTRGLVEEAPESYKDVDEVVRACHEAGLAKPVARLVPLGVVKG
ncbi:RtcB family protein [Saccharopolyspora phatthalungensis]|uniref:tRNA-splicing ligase RtcB n=1 Tax=Saccharopolyspora phatthalungensis TaxID=664693 RepID=A0A840Q8G2_9PSEU|nr:RtcB family protein [Saccharopolyspora phatthalungensis]MBB5156031.1 tRNA-splicing ligase RtcB [Saccharopolyspora phatthalungensis]